MKIAHIVRSIIDENSIYYEPFIRGILSIQNFARYIKPQVEQMVNEEVTIDTVTKDDDYSMLFTVTDSCGNAILGLSVTDFTIVDDIGGTLTNDGFTEVGSGVYNYATVEIQYLGEIQLVSTKYNATADYEFIEPEFSPADFSSDFKIT